MPPNLTYLASVFSCSRPAVGQFPGFVQGASVGNSKLVCTEQRRRAKSRQTGVVLLLLLKRKQLIPLAPVGLSDHSFSSIGRVFLISHASHVINFYLQFCSSKIHFYLCWQVHFTCQPHTEGAFSMKNQIGCGWNLYQSRLKSCWNHVKHFWGI